MTIRQLRAHRRYHRLLPTCVCPATNLRNCSLS